MNLLIVQHSHDSRRIYLAPLPWLQSNDICAGLTLAALRVVLDLFCSLTRAFYPDVGAEGSNDLYDEMLLCADLSQSENDS